MKLGILSDTHGNIPATEMAALGMEAADVKAVLHCGDIGGLEVLEKLAAVFQPRSVPIYVVFGNMDLPVEQWASLPPLPGVELLGRFGELELAGKRVALLHGDDHALFGMTIFSGHFDFVFSGHTHVWRDRMIGKTRCINPGSAGRGFPCTCGVLDLSNEALHAVHCG